MVFFFISFIKMRKKIKIDFTQAKIIPNINNPKEIHKHYKTDSPP